MPYVKKVDTILTKLRAFKIYKSYLHNVLHDCKNEEQDVYFNNELSRINKLIGLAKKELKRNLKEYENYKSKSN